MHGCMYITGTQRQSPLQQAVHSLADIKSINYTPHFHPNPTSLSLLDNYVHHEKAITISVIYFVYGNRPGIIQMWHCTWFDHRLDFIAPRLNWSTWTVKIICSRLGHIDHNQGWSKTGKTRKKIARDNRYRLVLKEDFSTLKQLRQGLNDVCGSPLSKYSAKRHIHA